MIGPSTAIRHIPEQSATTPLVQPLSMSVENFGWWFSWMAEEEPLIISTGQRVLLAGTPIPDSDLKLKNTVVVLIERTNDGYIISSRDLQEDAFGSSPEEADSDFLTSLKDRLESLSRRNNLSEDERVVLQRLRDLLTSN